MERRERIVFNKEAAVDELMKGCFWDKPRHNKDLLQIHEDEQKGQKVGKNRAKKR